MMKEGCENGLERGRFQVTVEDDLNYDGDKERFSREIAFWGRRDGQMIYENVSQETVKIETEFTPSSAAQNSAGSLLLRDFEGHRRLVQWIHRAEQIADGPQVDGDEPGHRLATRRAPGACIDAIPNAPGASAMIRKTHCARIAVPTTCAYRNP